MNDVRLSTTTKSLLAAAKAEAPSVTARMKVWEGVSSAIVGSAGATGSAGGAQRAWTTGGGGATKLLTIGALFGGTVTVGLATVLLCIAPARKQPSRMLGSSIPALGPIAAEMPSTNRESPTPANASLRTAPDAPPIPVQTRSSNHASKPATTAIDSLALEASLVTEGRRALGRGDPQSALRAIRAARALPSRQLVPEELAVEEQALRALGQSDEANGIDVQLRLQYPESALAR
jgi:hypothetical protein